jgi:amino acid transporter
MAILLGVLFVGITFVADSFGLVPIDFPTTKTIISQVAAITFGENSIPFYLFQAFTALILFLAANTSYAAFPRLGAILARDGYMPRQFSFRSDRPYRPLPRRHPRLDPALLGRSLHLVHDQPGRHGQALDP